MENKSAEKDPLWQQILATGRLGEFPVMLYGETTSTNEQALKAAAEGAATHSLFIAESQTKGRGRLGRNWQSPPGAGLYFSMLLRPTLAPGDLPKITLAAGLATCKAVHKVTSLKPQIKWPNDLLLEGKKFAGILTETESMAGDEKPVVILGIGMNVNTLQEQFLPELQGRATSILKVCKRYTQRGRLLEEISEQIIRTLEQLEKDGFSDILAEWKELDATLGRELQWITQNNKVVTGISQGPDADGLLRIRDQTGVMHEVLSGDIMIAGSNHRQPE